MCDARTSSNIMSCEWNRNYLKDAKTSQEKSGRFNTEVKFNFATRSDFSVETKDKVHKIEGPQRHLNVDRTHNWHF